MKSTILLSNLFNGKYIEDGIGGEIINIYQSDNGNFYIYANPYGYISKDKDNTIQYVLFIRTIGNGQVKVIGKAKIEEQICLNAVKKLEDPDPEQVDYIDTHKITYGGVPLYKLGSWSSYFVTFKAEYIYKAKESIILETVENKNTLYLRDVKKINNTSQRLYIKSDTDNYQLLLDEVINNKELWEDEPVKQVEIPTKDETIKPRSFLSIIRKENDELVNSNLLAYFLRNDRQFWADFVSKILNEADVMNEVPVVKREVENIDLLIETSKYVFVIENKIKSGINGKRKDGYSQLVKYYNAGNDYAKDKKHRYYLLRPDYNKEDYHNHSEDTDYKSIVENYKSIRYSDVYSIIENREGDFFFQEFKQVVKKHSSEYDNELFEIMNERFIEEIRAKKGGS